MSESKDAVNVYTCQMCGWQAVTKNREEGTTPFMIGCQADGCDGDCYSGFYRCDQALEPTHEWYRPTTTGERKQLNNQDMRSHFEMGGLFLRKLKTH